MRRSTRATISPKRIVTMIENTWFKEASRTRDVMPHGMLAMFAVHKVELEDSEKKRSKI
jgi:hypothetical protein